MTIALILNIAVSTLVFAAVVGSVLWSITTQQHDLANAGTRTRDRRQINTSRAPLRRPARVQA
jgi:nitrogen fixation-related uncharacterized protein